MSEIVEKIQKDSIRRLQGLLQVALDGVERQVVDQIGSFLALSQKQDDVLMAFVINLNDTFDKLLDKEVIKDEAIFDYENLSLVQEEELDVMVALEGMVNASRNDHLPSFISFNTRLNSLFPRKRIDESSNPLDPQQIASCFQEALRPIGLDAQNSLAVYRAFNKGVLKKLDEVLHEANHTLMEHGVIPDLGMEGSKKGSKGARMAPRKDAISAFGTVEEQISEEDEESPELFSMMQNLLHTDEPQQPSGSQPETTPAAGADAIAGPVTGQPQGGNVEAALQQVTQQYMVPTNMVEAGTTAEGGAVMQAFQPAADQQVQMVDQSQLMSILTTIQKSLEVRETGTAASIPNHVDEIQKIDISGSLGEMLNQDGDDSVVNAVDRHSSDVINLVTLLYEAIWDDESVPIPIKELIGRTQITIMKVALTDQEFFNLEDHPARAILNEFAAAGIGWTEVEKLDEDPLYQKIEELVNKMLLDFDDEVSFFEDLIKDFRAFLASEAAKTRQLEQSILKAKERQDRLEDINELVTQKIDERILGRELHPFVSALLENQFHKFMVLLVLKEGPGSNAWRQAINTIDVLLWSIQIHDHDGDRERLETINPRLLNNLRKALRIASVESSEVDKLITALKEVQDETFVEEEVVEEEVVEEESPEDGILPLDLAQEQALADDDSAEAEEPSIPLLETVVEVSDEEPEQQADAAPVEQEKEAVEEEDFSEYLHQVDTLGVGMWVEFTGQDEINPRCKLAAKINAIDKFIFVNQQGVKVVEKTKLGLAKELKEGTVKIISDGLLFSRALESVIGNLRESQHREQTGSAYQPQSESQA